MGSMFVSIALLPIAYLNWRAGDRGLALVVIGVASFSLGIAFVKLGIL